MILSGEKKEEYREIKPYWENRFYEFDIVSRNNSESFKKPIGFKNFDVVKLVNGYGKKAPFAFFELNGIKLSIGNPDWGAKKGEPYFCLALGRNITSSMSE
jgi:hypothetical protein